MSKKEMGKNETAWEELFKKYDILSQIQQNQLFEITSTQINQFREARLMTKFDNKVALPCIFQENNLSILPITRGKYVISNFEVYKKFDNITNLGAIYSPLPDYIESINFQNITSEAIALNCAYASGILTDFLDEEVLYPSISGRMSSDKFSFSINTNKKSIIELSVNNSQIEVDGGYEGHKSIAIIEAKNYFADDFLIRQLYYPFRLFESKFNKPIRPIFVVYSNGIFNLYEYCFENVNSYNSLVLYRAKRYTVEPMEITLDDIINLSGNVKIIDEPKLQFPQADSFDRLVNLCELLNNAELSSLEITEEYAFDKRQTNYYTDAGRYLGLIQKSTQNNQVVFSLTSLGKKLFSLKHMDRQLMFVKIILQHKVFNKAFKLYVTKGTLPSKTEIVEIMKLSHLFRIEADSTFTRRASTVLSWINWILGLIKQQ